MLCLLSTLKPLNKKTIVVTVQIYQRVTDLVRRNIVINDNQLKYSAHSKLFSFFVSRVTDNVAHNCVKYFSEKRYNEGNHCYNPHKWTLAVLKILKSP